MLFCRLGALPTYLVAMEEKSCLRLRILALDSTWFILLIYLRRNRIDVWKDVNLSKKMPFDGP